MSRPPNAGLPSGPPLSFKPVPGRHRTQKWNVAKQYDYSGDDWGGYDAYDDYSGAQQPPMPSNAPPQPNYPSQLPSQQARAGRQMSFDRGDADEQRHFSSGPVLYAADSERSAGVSPARSAVSATSSGGRSGEFQRPPGMRPRDFTNPDQAPPPLRPGSRGSPALSSSPAVGAAGSPLLDGTAAFPPRKSSISSGSPAPEIVASATASAAKNEKELPTPPFIRPSDIYKRMAAEQERERRMSEDTGRPSMESIQRAADSPNNLSVSGRQQRPLSSVEEGPGESPTQTTAEPDLATLPSMKGRMSSFGTDWFNDGNNTVVQQTPNAAQSAARTATPARTTDVPSYMRAPLASTTSNSDPAAEILAERTHQTPISQIGRQPDALAHQPSQGYRSVVNKAFDHSSQSDSLPPTRDNSQSTTGVSRSDSESTTGISPILSRVPFSREQQQQTREADVPTIVEEQTAPSSSNAARKPIPTQSRSASTERDAAIAAVGAVAAGAAAVGVAAGYRRNFDPPESENSPAHTPEVQNAGRRLSDGFKADISASTEDSAIGGDQSTVLPLETPTAQLGGLNVTGPSSSAFEEGAERDIPKGRARAGTDYSTRESDIAAAVNNNGSSSNEPLMSPAEAAREEQAEQKLFLRTHSATPSTSGLPALDTAPSASPVASPASAQGTPVKSRVRAIADKYQDLHEASRRDSQTSLAGSTKSAGTWSRMDSEENFTVVKPEASGAQLGNLSRRGTDSTWDTTASETNEDIPEDVDTSSAGLNTDEGNNTLRPEVGREASFRPQLPGGWVSYQDAPTPAAEDDAGGELLPATTYTQMTPQSSRDVDRSEPEPVDFTPNNRAVPLQTTQESGKSSHADQAKAAGTALGAAFVTSAGAGFQTRDFGTSDPAQPVDQPEMRPKPAIGDLGFLQPPSRPELNRGDTETSKMTDVGSTTSSVPPTPPAKDPPAQDRSADRSSDYYFTVTPLRPSKSREASPDHFNPPSSMAAARPGVSPAMSTWARSSDTESDRLRKEIVRSLDSAKLKEKIEQDRERTQDALDAPANAERMSEGKDALPAAEIGAPRPGLLGQRFSWEPELGVAAAAVGAGAGAVAANSAQSTGTAATDRDLPPPPIVKEPEPEESPEIKPEMPFERPRSRGLHIMNADSDSDEEKPVDSRDYLPSRTLLAGTTYGGPVSPITKSQENLNTNSAAEPTRPVTEGLSDHSSVDASRNNSAQLPDRYILDIPGLERSRSEDDPAAAAPELAPEEVPPETPAKDLASPTRDLKTTPLDADPYPLPVGNDLPSPTSPTINKKIPPFREILAIKSPHERIQTYDDTRQTFADMNTGLSDWLSNMLEQHPEHAGLSTTHAGTGFPDASMALGNLKGHKTSPSLAKFTRNFSGTQTGGSPQHQGDSQPGAESVQRTPTKDFGDMDKLQQRGKDLMKNASVLGGRAGASAKGLLAKGKSRFGSTRDSRGGSKDLSAFTATPTAPQPRVLDRSDPDSILQPIPITTGPAGPLASQSGDDGAISRSTSNRSSTFGPLSRTLSRLRSRSRSKSASRSLGSNSRPTSIVLLASDLTSVQDVSPRAERMGRSPTPDATTDSAISPWKEPDAALPFGDESAAAPQRLGILPSPTALTFAATDRDSPPRMVDDDAPPVPPMSLARSSPRPSPRLSGKIDSRSEDVDPKPVIAIDHGDLPMAAGSVEDNDEELYVSTPRQSNFPQTRELAESGGGTFSALVDTTPKAPQNPWTAVPGAYPPSAVSTDRDIAEDEVVTGADMDERTSNDAAVPSADSETVAFESAAVGLLTAGAAIGAGAMSEHNELSIAADNVDTRSQISAEEHKVAPAAVRYTSLEQEMTSRRSSVSSLGEPGKTDTIAKHYNEKVTEPDRLPVAPSIGSISPAPPKGATMETATETLDAGAVHKSQDPNYLSRPELGRPLSFEPLRRDAGGAPVQETLPKPAEPLPLDPEDEWAAATAFNTTTLTRHRKVSIPTPDRKSKRMSGFLKDSDLPYATRPEEPIQEPIQNPAVQPTEERVQVPPKPRLSSGHFVEEDMAARPEERNIGRPSDGMFGPRTPGHAYPAAAVAVASRNVDQPIDEEKQPRRKSGMFDAFRRGPSTSKDREKAAQQGTEIHFVPRQPTPAATFPRNAPRSSTHLDRPQRSSTTATEPEKKKKRFSGIGSLFGRSSTTGHKSDSRRLTKSKGHPPPESLGRSSLQWPESSDSSLQRRNLQTPSQHGWYAPADVPNYEAGFQRYPPAQQIYPDSQRVQRSDQPWDRVPESFRPMIASDGRFVRPTGAPDSPSPTGAMYSQDTSQYNSGAQAGRMSYSQDRLPVDKSFDSRAPQIRQISDVPSEQGLSPQISGRSDWERNVQQMSSSFPSISPTITRPGLDNESRNEERRLGSVSEQMPYMRGSLEQQYSESSSAMPPINSSSNPAAGSSRSSYWARQRRSQEPSGPASGDGYNYQPVVDTGRGDEGYSRVPRHVQPSPPTEYGQAISTDDPALHARLSHEGNYSARRQLKASMQNAPMMRGQRQQYVEEDEPVQMRGVSYPGQEWAPDGWD